MSEQLRVFSYGGGVQSTAALVLAAQGKIDFPTFLFANVGDDSEHPATLRYVREVALPYAERQGIRLEELRRQPQRGVYKGQAETLYGRLMREGSRSLPIPLRMSETGAPGTRSCTADFKIKVLSRRCKELGATPEAPAAVGLGISLDEFHRARTDSGEPVQVLEYPLIALRLSRQDCMNLIERAGVEVPPKSSCWFCPYHTRRYWQHMRDNEPGLFWKSVGLERTLNERRAMLGKDPVWLTDRLVPLDQATSPHRQLPLLPDDGDTCESGYCMT